MDENILLPKLLENGDSKKITGYLDDLFARYRQATPRKGQNQILEDEIFPAADVLGAHKTGKRFLRTLLVGAHYYAKEVPQKVRILEKISAVLSNNQRKRIKILLEVMKQNAQAIAYEKKAFPVLKSAIQAVPNIKKVVNYFDNIGRRQGMSLYLQNQCAEGILSSVRLHKDSDEKIAFLKRAYVLVPEKADSQTKGYDGLKKVLREILNTAQEMTEGKGVPHLDYILKQIPEGTDFARAVGEAKRRQQGLPDRQTCGWTFRLPNQKKPIPKKNLNKYAFYDV